MSVTAGSGDAAAAAAPAPAPPRDRRKTRRRMTDGGDGAGSFSPMADGGDGAGSFPPMADGGDGAGSFPPMADGGDGAGSFPPMADGGDGAGSFSPMADGGDGAGSFSPKAAPPPPAAAPRKGWRGKAVAGTPGGRGIEEAPQPEGSMARRKRKRVGSPEEGMGWGPSDASDEGLFVPMQPERRLAWRKRMMKRRRMDSHLDLGLGSSSSAAACIDSPSTQMHSVPPLLRARSMTTHFALVFAHRWLTGSDTRITWVDEDEDPGFVPSDSQMLETHGSKRCFFWGYRLQVLFANVMNDCRKILFHLNMLVEEDLAAGEAFNLLSLANRLVARIGRGHRWESELLLIDRLTTGRKGIVKIEVYHESVTVTRPYTKLWIGSGGKRALAHVRRRRSPHTQDEAVSIVRAGVEHAFLNDHFTGDICQVTVGDQNFGFPWQLEESELGLNIPRTVDEEEIAEAHIHEVDQQFGYVAAVEVVV